MKKYIYLFLISVVALGFNSCSDDDDNAPGNPVINANNSFNTSNKVLFGDSLPFKINVSDSEVPLSTLKVRLYYSEEIVSETVIRTKTNGDYSGKIFIPYYANIPNGTATLKLVLQNIHLTITEQEFDLPVQRPDFPYLTFVSSEGEYKMNRIGLYEYEAKDNFPEKINGYIKSPIVGSNGNEIFFGWEDNAIIQGSQTSIPFSYFSAGEYSISFNTLNYEAAPFIVNYVINDVTMTRIDENNYKAEISLTQGQDVEVTGISDFSNWWIDEDFFNKSGANLKFKPISGKYRITADFSLKYLKVEAMQGSNVAGLQSDGSGAIWIIGDSQGKPAYSNSGWDPNKAICMAPMGNGKYQTSFVAGKTITSKAINFVFFHVKDWSPSFGPETLSVNSELVIIGKGKDVNGVDKGNIALADGKTLTDGKTYVFVVDVSAGIDKAVLTVEEK